MPKKKKSEYPDNKWGFFAWLYENHFWKLVVSFMLIVMSGTGVVLRQAIIKVLGL